MAAIELPAVPGISARLFAGEADFPAIARLVDADALAIGQETVTDPAVLPTYFANAENLDLTRDCLFVEVDGQPVGYVIGRWFQRADGPRVYRHMCKLLPEWEDRGIGTAMLHWVQGHLAAIAAGHDVPDKVYQTDGNPKAKGLIALLEANGYHAIEFFAELVRPHLDEIPDAPLPEGLEIRPVTEDQFRTIFDADTEAFRDHWGFVEPTEADYRQFLDFPYRDESLWKVAWDGDRVAGQVRSFIDEPTNKEFDRKRGWTEFISTAREWRGKGVARALICESLRELKQRGMTEAALGVHVANPHGAYRLYESLGYEKTEEGSVWEKPLEGAP
jgi:ribosomal protein S18 acetylase RimI-like enzyme